MRTSHGCLVGLSLFFSLHAPLSRAVAGPPPAPECKLGRKLLRVDQAMKSASLQSARQELLAAVAARDVAVLSRLIAPDIKHTFGEGSGRPGFLKQWQLDGALAGQSKLWETLDRTLNQGGAWTHEEFCFPYYSVTWPESCDAFEHQLVIGERVPLKKEPAASSQTLALLANELVQRAPGAMPAPYQQVTARGGLQGYVQSSALESPIGYRGCFQKQGTKWVLSSFLAGD